MKGIKRLLSLAMAGALLLGTNLSEILSGSDRFFKLSGASAEGGNSIQAVIQAVQKSSDKEASKEKSEDKKESSKSKKEESSKSEKAEKKNDNAKKEVRLTLSISKPSDLGVSDGIYQVDPTKVSKLTLSWKCKGECDEYEVTVSGGVYSGNTEKTSVKLSVGDLSAGKYTATVKAIRDGKTVAKEKLSFQIIAPKAEEPTQAPQEESEAQETEDVQTAEEAQASGEDKLTEDTQDTEDEKPVEDMQATEEDKSVEDMQVTEDKQPAEDAQTSKDEQSDEDKLTSKDEQPVEDMQVVEDEQQVEDKQVSEDKQPDEDKPTSEDEQPVEDVQASKDDVQPAVDTQQIEDVKAVEEADASTEDQSADETQSPVEDQPANEAQSSDEGQPADEAQDNPREQPVDSQPAESGAREAQEEQDAPAIEVEDVPEDLLADIPVDAPEDLSIQAPELVEDTQANDEQPAEDAPQEAENEAVANAPGESEEKTDNTLTLSIMGAQGVTVVGGTVHVNPAMAGSVTFSWKFGGSCDEYSVSVSGDAYSGVTKDTSAAVSVANLAAGQYTATVKAVKDGKKLASARLSFQVDAGEIADGELVVTIASPQDLFITEGVYQVDPTQVDALGFAWQFGGDCNSYNVSVSGDAYSGRTGDTALTLPLVGLAAGTYTVTVSALNGEETAAQATLDFNIAGEEQGSQDQQGQQGEGEGQQGGQPGGGSAPKGGGSRSGSAKGGDEAEAEQGFHITPGEALVSTHTSGNRDMRLYGAVALTLDNDGAMTWLTLGGTPLDIRLDDDSPFTASIEDDTLILTPEGDAQAWLLNGFALKTLARSGIETLRLTLNDETVDFSTQPTLTGNTYGALCAAGRTSRDYSFAVYADGCRVTVAEQTFLLTESGELV